MLKIYKSNQINFLLKKICKKFISKQSKNILNKETILIDNNYIKTWLEIYMSKKIGITINVKYTDISKFFIRCINLEDIQKKKNFSLFHFEYLYWILMYITQNKNECLFLKQAGILFNNRDFCTHMTHVFRQYLVYQPEIIYKWENNIDTKDNFWQKKLWNLIIQKIKYLKQKNFTTIIDYFSKNIKKNYIIKNFPKKILILSNTFFTPLVNFVLNYINDITSIYFFYYQQHDSHDTKNNQLFLLSQKKNFLCKQKKNHDNIVIKKNFF